MQAVWTPLMALYNYDPSILDNLHVPTVDELSDNIEYIDPLPELSDEDLRLELLFELGELSPVYSDPEILKQMIAIWDRVNHKNWLQLWQTTLYKYNPIWNKDGSYTETRDLSADKTASEDTSANGSETFSGENSQTRSGTESGTHSETTTHTVTGYDTNTLSPAYADATSGTTSSTTGETVNGESGSTTTTTAKGSRDGEENRSEHETITRRETGNIGVTTTQAMIREQREIVEFNIYNFIIESFKKRFMIQVYDI